MAATQRTSGKPEQSFTIGGFRPTGRYRIRMSWLFLIVVEQLYEYHTGEFRWRRLKWMDTVEFTEGGQ